MLPVKRDPDGCIYAKEELCGLLTGGFKPQPKPWAMDPIPSSFQFALLGENWGSVRAADEVRNAPHAVTGNRAGEEVAQRAGELHARWQLHHRRGPPELRNYFVAPGFNSAGIANSDVAGKR